MASHSVMEIEADTPETWLAHYAEHGDDSAFEKLVHYFEGSIHAYLARCGLNAAEREDLAQDIYLRLHRASASYRPERPARVWVFTVVANCARSYFRRRAVRAKTPEETVLPEPVTLPAADELHAAGELAHLLQSALDRLGLVQREVVLLHALQAMSIAEIASALALPAGTVKTHLHRGRLLLAKALARREAQTRREQE